MAAARYNIVMEQGADFPFRITWTDSAGALVNLTGYRIRWQIREKVSDTVKLLDFDSAALGAGMTIDALGVSGVININLSPVVTSALAFAQGVYDLTATSGAGVVTRLVEGKASLTLAVTR